LSIKEKILLRKTGNRLIATIDNSGIYPEQSLYFLYNFKKGFNSKYLLSIINSELMNWYYLNELVTNIDSTPQLKTFSLESFPIIVAKNQSPFINLVDYILVHKIENTDTSFFERVIDAMVYELYLPEEIKAGGAEVLKHLKQFT
jgi:adenine-specific DNA-methyltransferase